MIGFHDSTPVIGVAGVSTSAFPHAVAQSGVPHQPCESFCASLQIHGGIHSDGAVVLTEVSSLVVSSRHGQSGGRWRQYGRNSETVDPIAYRVPISVPVRDDHGQPRSHRLYWREPERFLDIVRERK